MSDQAELFLAQLMLDFQDRPSFECARRIWLLCYHLEITIPEVVMKVFLNKLESDDKAWKHKPKHGLKLELACFVEVHMAQQVKEKGKASESEAIEAYQKYIYEKHETTEDPKTLEKRLERYKKKKIKWW